MALHANQAALIKALVYRCQYIEARVEELEARIKELEAPINLSEDHDLSGVSAGKQRIRPPLGSALTLSDIYRSLHHAPSFPVPTPIDKHHCLPPCMYESTKADTIQKHVLNAPAHHISKKIVTETFCLECGKTYDTKFLPAHERKEHGVESRSRLEMFLPFWPLLGTKSIFLQGLR